MTINVEVEMKTLRKMEILQPMHIPKMFAYVYNIKKANSYSLRFLQARGNMLSGIRIS
jgi:hypothetical protein